MDVLVEISVLPLGTSCLGVCGVFSVHMVSVENGSDAVAGQVYIDGLGAFVAGVSDGFKCWSLALARLFRHR